MTKIKILVILTDLVDIFGDSIIGPNLISKTFGIRKMVGYPLIMRGKWDNFELELLLQTAFSDHIFVTRGRIQIPYRSFNFDLNDFFGVISNNKFVDKAMNVRII